MEATNIKIEEAHISTLKPGDTVKHNGIIQTLGKNNISYSSFMGSSIFGDTYRMGTSKVKKVLFKVPTNNGIVYR